MIDLRLLREDPDSFRAASVNKRIPSDIDGILALDGQLRALRQDVEEIRSRRNAVSRSISRLQGAEKEQALEEARALRERVDASEPEMRALEEQLQALLLTVPNLPDSSVPVGASESDNVEIRRWGTPPTFDFAPRDHVDLALRLGLADFQRGSKVSGSRFVYLKGDGALLQLAVLRLAMDHLVADGFMPMIVPELVREDAMAGTGYFPLGRDDAYALERDDLYLIGTSEVALVSYHQDEILPAAELARRYAGISSCFRREAGAAGRDTRGFYRVHQFQKVEQVVICANEPDIVRAEHERLLANSEAIVRSLGLPHRVALACTGELGMGQTYKHEIETWMPSRETYSETHSCSTLGEFQARRLNIRYRDRDGRVRYCATLNNTAIASPRILIPLLETYQQADGSVVIPDALRPYLGGREILRPVA